MGMHAALKHRRWHIGGVHAAARTCWQQCPCRACLSWPMHALPYPAPLGTMQQWAALLARVVRPTCTAEKNELLDLTIHNVVRLC